MAILRPAHMTGTDSNLMLALGVIGFALVTVILHTLARMAEEHRRLEDLRSRALKLREGYSRRLAELSGRGMIEVSPVDEADAPVEVAEAA